MLANQSSTLDLSHMTSHMAPPRSLHMDERSVSWMASTIKTKEAKKQAVCRIERVRAFTF